MTPTMTLLTWSWRFGYRRFENIPSDVCETLARALETGLVQAAICIPTTHIPM